MRSFMAFLVAAALASAAAWALSADDKPAKPQAKPDPKKVKELMALKLEHSQKLLAALVLNDLPKSKDHAEALVRVRKEASFAVLKTGHYDMFSTEFQMSLEKIVRGSNEKNLDLAKMGYLEMTLTCFNCHTYVRDQQ